MAHEIIYGIKNQVHVLKATGHIIPLITHNYYGIGIHLVCTLDTWRKCSGTGKFVFTLPERL